MASFDVIFLGGGPAGYVGAIRCGQLGLSTAVVEREGLGGTCVLWGCIPAKSLLESAALANKIKHANEHGITLGDVKLDYGPRGAFVAVTAAFSLIAVLNAILFRRGRWKSKRV